MIDVTSHEKQASFLHRPNVGLGIDESLGVEYEVRSFRNLDIYLKVRSFDEIMYTIGCHQNFQRQF